MTNPAASPYTRPIQIGSATLGGGFPFVLIAGPALTGNGHGVGHALTLADRLCAQTRDLDVPFIFRIAAPRRENRSAAVFKETLSVLQEIHSRLGVPVAVDVTEPHEVDSAADVADLLQIPAALCRQTNLHIEAAHTGKPVNVEIPSSLSLAEAVSLLDTVVVAGNWNVMLTDCGRDVGHDPLVAVRALTVMRETGFPVVFDAGRQPVARLDARLEPRTEDEMAETALAAGVDGIALLVEEDEKRDTASSTVGYSLAALPPLLHRLKEIEQAVKPT